MTEQDVLRQLKAHAETFPSVSQAAVNLGVSQQLLEATLAKRRRIGPRMLAAFGYRRVVRYESIRPARRRSRSR